MKKKHVLFLHAWKAINHMNILELSYFRYNLLLLIDEYLPHTVIDPQATTSSYLYEYMCTCEIYIALLFATNVSGISQHDKNYTTGVV